MAKVRKAVITAAGRGTRQYPASSAVQKEMFPLVDRDGLTKPVIQIIGEEASNRASRRSALSPSRGKSRCIAIISNASMTGMAKRFAGKEWAMRESERLGAFGQRLHFAEQRWPEGFGHAVFQATAPSSAMNRSCCSWAIMSTSAMLPSGAPQLIAVFEKYDLDAATSVQPTLESQLHLFGTIRGAPVDSSGALFKAELIIEKPTIEVAHRQLATPGLPAGNYLSHFGMHIFTPRIFESLEYFIANNIREKGEIQLTAAQEHLRARPTNTGPSSRKASATTPGFPSA